MVIRGGIGPPLLSFRLFGDLEPNFVPGIVVLDAGRDSTELLEPRRRGAIEQRPVECVVHAQIGQHVHKRHCLSPMERLGVAGVGIDSKRLLMPYQLLHRSVAANATQVGAPMDFTALRYFSETAHSRSIRAASERLHVSASAISRQIAKLEHELRAPIFDRRAKGMTLTPAGLILREKFEGMMREFTPVKSHIAALQDIQAGTVDVYCFQTAIESFVALVLHRFHAQYPNVMFNIRMSSTDEAMEALTSGVAEIGLILNPPARDNIATTQVFRDSI